jgi:serine protease inhibitor ecotin
LKSLGGEAKTSILERRDDKLTKQASTVAVCPFQKPNAKKISQKVEDKRMAEVRFAKVVL